MNASTYFANIPMTPANIELYADLKYNPPTPKYTIEELTDIGIDRSVHEIISIVANGYGIDPKTIHTPRKLTYIVEPRQVMMALVHKQVGVTCTMTGFIFARKDYTTVLHACKVVRLLYKTNRPFREKLKPILAKCGIHSDEEFYELMARRRWD